MILLLISSIEAFSSLGLSDFFLKVYAPLFTGPEISIVILFNPVDFCLGRICMGCFDAFLIFSVYSRA